MKNIAGGGNDELPFKHIDPVMNCAQFAHELRALRSKNQG